MVLCSDTIVKTIFIEENDSTVNIFKFEKENLIIHPISSKNIIIFYFNKPIEFIRILNSQGKQVANYYNVMICVCVVAN